MIGPPEAALIPLAQLPMESPLIVAMVPENCSASWPVFAQVMAISGEPA